MKCDQRLAAVAWMLVAWMPTVAGCALSQRRSLEAADVGGDQSADAAVVKASGESEASLVSLALMPLKEAVEKVAGDVSAIKLALDLRVTMENALAKITSTIDAALTAQVDASQHNRAGGNINTNSNWPLVWLVLGFTTIIAAAFVFYLMAHRFKWAREAIDRIKGKAACEHARLI